MSKYIGPKLKLIRREKTDLYLKSGIKNIENKCKINQTPGQIHLRKSRISNYSIQLREKQKLKRIYCILEKQFYNYYKKSIKKKRNTGVVLLQMLESRLDNIVYRMGFGSTRLESRQLINHKLIKVNGKIINIPSYNLLPNSKIELSEKMINNVKIKFSINLMKNRENIPWVNINENELYGFFLYIPDRKEFLKEINENLIIEFYSR
ncbi:30S ribosomal protein S4 [endosymbiont of Euscepes postfasciatus]|uniref:30S ribosomal protein S4 n=1 Tax=endosymbiont of Euscepes postfasciatus TaxID=650377 RepID=UPI000DC740D6|nr:30S ribosomal protein S4 [endosymbiont of Euscepes postfasciatus]BBA84670.1 30S ribosomal protein S4 [endosymbiont of Euscepes postfasciatus]